MVGGTAGRIVGELSNQERHREPDSGDKGQPDNIDPLQRGINADTRQPGKKEGGAGDADSFSKNKPGEWWS